MKTSFIPPELVPFAESATRVIYSNPFLPERIKYEREALGSDYREMERAWNVYHMEPSDDPNITTFCEKTAEAVAACRKNLSIL